MLKKKSLWIALGCLLISSLVSTIVARNWYARMQLQSRMNLLNAAASAIAEAERRFHQEFGRYTSELSEAGFAPTAQLEFIIVSRPESVPIELMKKLSPGELPFASEDFFRILLIYDSPERSRSIMFVTPEGTSRRAL